MADDDTPKRLHLVEGDGQPKPYHRGSGLKQIICRTCEADTGVAYGGPWIEGPATAWEEHGELVEKGRPTLFCPNCLSRGKNTRVI